MKNNILTSFIILILLCQLIRSQKSIENNNNLSNIKNKSGVTKFSIKKTYFRGDVVIHNDKVYQADVKTRGNNPSDENSQFWKPFEKLNKLQESNQNSGQKQTPLQFSLWTKNQTYQKGQNIVYKFGFYRAKYDILKRRYNINPVSCQKSYNSSICPWQKIHVEFEQEEKVNKKDIDDLNNEKEDKTEKPIEEKKETNNNNGKENNNENKTEETESNKNNEIEKSDSNTENKNSNSTQNSLVYEFQGGYTPTFYIRNPTNKPITIESVQLETYQTILQFGYYGAELSKISDNKFQAKFVKPLTVQPKQRIGYFYKASGYLDVAMAPIKVFFDNQRAKIFQKCQNSECNSPTPGYEVFGYYTNWDMYARKYNSEDIPVKKLNNIVYAFIGYNQQGDIHLLDPNSDIRHMPQISNFRAQYPYLNAYLSFGGWTLSFDFSNMASNNQSRQNFVKNSIRVMRETGFNGIDIDWEFPVTGPQGENGPIPGDANAWALLLEDLRKELDIAGEQDGQKYKLAIAISAGIDKMQDVFEQDSSAWKRVVQACDFVNIMSYDFHGAWSKFSNTQSPMTYDPEIQQEDMDLIKKYTIDACIDYLFNDLQLNPAKFTFGIPLYARTVMIQGSGDKYGLYQPTSGAPDGQYDDTGVFDYRCIKQVQRNQACSAGQDQFLPQVKWVDSKDTAYLQYGQQSKTPWGYSNDYFVSYDDVDSLIYKIEYMKQRGMKGIMFWQLAGDLPSNDSDSLVNQTYLSLRK